MMITYYSDYIFQVNVPAKEGPFSFNGCSCNQRDPLWMMKGRTKRVMIRDTFLHNAQISGLHNLVNWHQHPEDECFQLLRVTYISFGWSWPRRLAPPIDAPIARFKWRVWAQRNVICTSMTTFGRRRLSARIRRLGSFRESAYGPWMNSIAIYEISKKYKGTR
jgi:hypothetical protein